MKKKALRGGQSYPLNDGDFVTVDRRKWSRKIYAVKRDRGSLRPIDTGAIVIDGKMSPSSGIQARCFGRIFQDPMNGTCSK